MVYYCDNFNQIQPGISVVELKEPQLQGKPRSSPDKSILMKGSSFVFISSKLKSRKMAEKYFGFHDIKIIESESHRDKDSCVGSIVKVFSVTLTVTVRRVDLEQIYNVQML